MIPLERLLEPVSAESPTGADASLSGLLLELEGLIQGRPETQFSAAEEPNWRAVLARCLEVAAGTRDLRVGAILTAVLLRTNGLPGLQQGLQLLRGYVEQYWDQVHPRLDPSDGNDPQERINALSNLAAPPGTDGDMLRVIEALRRTPLIESPQTGRFALADWLAARGMLPGAESTAPSLTVIDGTRKDTNPERLATDAAAAAGSLAELTGIGVAFARQAGDGNLPGFDLLRRDLQQIVAWIGPGDTAEAIAPAGNESGPGEVLASRVAVTAAPGVPGEIRSREDVLRGLDAIIAYYKVHEPSSPVPFLLLRVKRIVPLNFMELIRDLSPESIDKLLVLTGPLDGETPPSS